MTQPDVLTSLRPAVRRIFDEFFAHDLTAVCFTQPLHRCSLLRGKLCGNLPLVLLRAAQWQSSRPFLHLRGEKEERREHALGLLFCCRRVPDSLARFSRVFTVAVSACSFVIS